MKRVLLIALLAIPAHAAPRWLKRVAVAGACAASMLDMASTVSAVNRGGIETNPLLVGPAGQPRYGRAIGIKVGLCAAHLVASELSKSKDFDRALLIAAGAEIGVFGFVARHNSGVAR